MTHLIHVGNSLGVRIPKAIITQIGFNEETELEFKIVKNGLLISAAAKRKGWEEAFKNAGKEKLLLADKAKNKFDEEEWEW